jgi:hypothetical protein
MAARPHQFEVALPPSLFLVFLIALVIFHLFPYQWFQLHQELPLYWLREGGIYESFGALFAVLSGILFFICARRAFADQQKLAGVWLIAGSILCLFIALEEVSWGQHVFHFEVSKEVADGNFQGEFNIHNSKIFREKNTISHDAFRLLTVFMAFLPLMVFSIPKLGAFFARFSIPIPSVAIASLAICTKFIDSALKIRGIASHEGLAPHRYGEIQETMMELCLFAFAIEQFIRWSNRKKHVA